MRKERRIPAWPILLPILFAATAAAPAQPIRITGRVLEAQEPFAGARVELYPAVSVPEDAPLKSTRTGPDGTFELPVPESGAYRVVVQAKDRLAMEHLAVPVVEEVSLPPAELMRPRRRSRSRRSGGMAGRSPGSRSEWRGPGKKLQGGSSAGSPRSGGVLRARTAG